MTQLSIVKPTPHQWREVATLTDFPILAETRARIRQQLKNKSVNFDDLAHFVEQDPALCLHLLQSIARNRPGSLEQVTGATSCLALLGMEELVRLVKHLPVVEPHCDDFRLQCYRRALLVARLAGNLAADWAVVHATPAPHYARWNAMLAGAPLWQWLLHTAQAQNWLYRLTQGDDLGTALTQVFGSSQREWQKLAKALHLPVMAQAMFEHPSPLTRSQWQVLRRHDPRDAAEHRRLLHACHQPAMLCVMANTLAWHWHIAPASRRSLRWQALTAHWLGRSAFVLQPHLRQLQLLTTRQQHSSEGTGLHLLLSPVATCQPYAWVNPLGLTEQAVATSPAAITAAPRAAGTEERHTDTSYMKTLLHKIQQEPDTFGDLPYLMRGMLKGVCSGLGMPGACIALLNRNRTALKVFYSEGIEDNAPVRQLLIDLRSPSLFSKLMEKQAAVLINASNRDRYFKQLPASISTALPVNCMMMSIDAGASPIGLVMAFGGSHAVTPAEFIDFKNLCIVTCHGLTQLRLQGEEQRRRQPQSE